MILVGIGMPSRSALLLRRVVHWTTAFSASRGLASVGAPASQGRPLDDRAPINGKNRHFVRFNSLFHNKKSDTADAISLSLAGEEGIEPPLTVLETVALPLYYSPMDADYNTNINSKCQVFIQNQNFLFCLSQNHVPAPVIKSISTTTIVFNNTLGSKNSYKIIPNVCLTT